MASGEVPDFYSWEIIAFGFTPHERINRRPTEEELTNAVVIVIRFKSIGSDRQERFVTVRHPVGFGVVPFQSLMEDIQAAVDMAADRYQIELVES